MIRPHDSIIADAAKAELGPLGFSRKGRSRLWWADNGWWLTIIEFQPSAWSKGSYLNVSAHWLWSEVEWSFDYGGRLDGYEEYLNAEQFAPAATLQAQVAATEARRLAGMFTSISATADILIKDARQWQDRGRGGGWGAYNAGIAAGLNGQMRDALEMFDQVIDMPPHYLSLLCKAATNMKKHVGDPAQFRREVAARIALCRSTLKLPDVELAF